MNLAIIGATGNVGRKTVEILERSKIKIDSLFLNHISICEKLTRVEL